jgi:pimeloyl-ACP methyl ester carboxylesterase
VSGYAVVPDRAAPPGGFPVITWAHGTTGTARLCGPSLFSNAPDAAGVYLVPDLGSFISAGYAVAATDYEGLGGPGVHPYLVGKSEGQDVLDAALAAAQLPGVHLSRRTVIVGHSQGGQAALFAGELATSYAPRLHVVGTVAIAPLTEVALALPLAAQFGQLTLLAAAAYGWAHTYPDLPMQKLFQPGQIARIDGLMSSRCILQVGTALQGASASTVFVPGFANDPVLRRHLVENSPGLVHTDSPVLVLHGTADATIPVILSQTFERQQCPKVHDDLQLRLYPGAGHGSVLGASAHDMLSWIADRLAGKPVAPGCSVVTVH